jgi:hypothetical protein
VSETILFPSNSPRPPAPPNRLVVVHKHGVAPSAWWVVAAVAAALTWYAWNSIPPSGDGVVAGRAFAPELSNALAAGFDAAAEAIEHGKSVAEADQALKTVFHDVRARAFADRVAPRFEAIVPSGTEPKDDATRRAFAQLHRDFAQGLRRSR